MVTLEESRSRKSTQINPDVAPSAATRQALQSEAAKSYDRTYKSRIIGTTRRGETYNIEEDLQHQQIAAELAAAPRRTGVFAHNPMELQKLQRSTGYQISMTPDELRNLQRATFLQSSPVYQAKQKQRVAEYNKMIQTAQQAELARRRIAGAQETEQQRQARINKWTKRMETLKWGTLTPALTKRQRANLRRDVEYLDKIYQQNMQKFEAGTQKAYEKGYAGAEGDEGLKPGTKIYEASRDFSRHIKMKGWQASQKVKEADKKYIQRFDKEINALLTATESAFNIPGLAKSAKFAYGVSLKASTGLMDVSSQSVGNVAEFIGMIPGGTKVMAVDVSRGVVPGGKKSKILTPAIRVGARESTIGTAEAFKEDPIQTAADMLATMALFGGAAKVSPIKTARVPTKTGTYRGAYLDIPSYQKGVVGKYQKGIGGFEGLKFKKPSEIDIHSRFVPRTPGETALSLEAIAKNFPNTTRQEFIAGLNLMRMLKSEKATAYKQLDISEAKYIPQKAAPIVQKWIRTETNRGGYIFGSASQKVQLKTGRMIKDIDFATKRNPQKAAQRLYDALVDELGPENVRLKRKVVEFKVDGEWHHAVDVHAISEIRGYFGFGAKGQKPIKVGEYKFIKVSEQFQRKASSSLTPRGKKFGPVPHRAKDVVDFITIANEFIKEGLSKSSQKLPVLKQMSTAKYLEAEKQFKIFTGIKDIREFPAKIKEISLRIEKETQQVAKSYLEEYEPASYFKSSHKRRVTEKYRYGRATDKKPSYVKGIPSYPKSKTIPSRPPASSVPSRFKGAPSEIPSYFPDLPSIFKSYSYLSRYPYPKPTVTSYKPSKVYIKRVQAKPTTIRKITPRRKDQDTKQYTKALREWREKNPIPTLDQILGVHKQSENIRRRKTIKKVRR